MIVTAIFKAKPGKESATNYMVARALLGMKQVCADITCTS